MVRPDATPGAGYRTQSPDTDAATEQYLFDRLRVLPPWRKAEMIRAAARSAYELALAGLRMRYPDAPASELRKRWAALSLGRELAIALFDWDPEREGW